MYGLPLQEVVEKCWVLWELMILAQPLMVIAPSPGAPPARLKTASLCGFHTGDTTWNAAYPCELPQAKRISGMYMAPSMLMPIHCLCRHLLSCCGCPDISHHPPFRIPQTSGRTSPSMTPCSHGCHRKKLPSNSNSLPRLLGVTNFYFLKVSFCHTGQP